MHRRSLFMLVGALVASLLPGSASAEYVQYPVTFPTPPGSVSADWLGMGDYEEITWAPPQARIYGVYSEVFKSNQTVAVGWVRNVLGHTDYLVDPDVVASRDVQLNDLQQDTGNPVYYWRHETTTGAWIPGGQPGGGTWGKWVFFWQSYPSYYTASPGTCDPANEVRDFVNSWIAMNTMNNAVEYDYPQPTTVAAKETRKFVGSYWQQRDQARISATGGWATGTPSAPPGLPSDYLALAEPGAFFDNGKLYLAFAAYKLDTNPDPPGSPACATPVADIWITRSTDGGVTWGNTCKLVDAAEAQAWNGTQWVPPGANYRYFTAPALYKHPDGSIRVMITPEHRTWDNVGGTWQANVNYNGALEYRFTNIDTCSRETNVSWFFFPNGNQDTADEHIGAAGYSFSEYLNNGQDWRQMLKFCKDNLVSNPTKAFRVGIWVPHSSYGDLCAA